MQEGKIYSLIPKIIGEIGGIAKDNKSSQGYSFRSVDDLYGKLNPLLTKYGVTIVPVVTESKTEVISKVVGTVEKYMYRAVLTVRYDIYADDGSFISAVVQGEANDSSDKGVPKALSMAYKYMCFQVFCIIIEGEAGDTEKENLTIEKEIPQDTRPLVDILSEKIANAKTKKDLTKVVNEMAKATGLTSDEIERLRGEGKAKQETLK